MNLLDIEMQIGGGEAVYSTARQLSIRLQHHLFDTLYHAEALESTDAVLVTADDRYHRKASGFGRIVRPATHEACAFVPGRGPVAALDAQRPQPVGQPAGFAV